MTKKDFFSLSLSLSFFDVYKLNVDLRRRGPMEGPRAALLVAEHGVRAGAPVGGGLRHLALQPVHRPLPLRRLQDQVVPHLQVREVLRKSTFLIFGRKSTLTEGHLLEAVTRHLTAW